MKGVGGCFPLFDTNRFMIHIKSIRVYWGSYLVFAFNYLIMFSFAVSVVCQLKLY